MQLNEPVFFFGTEFIDVVLHFRILLLDLPR